MRNFQIEIHLNGFEISGITQSKVGCLVFAYVFSPWNNRKISHGLVLH